MAEENIVKTEQNNADKEVSVEDKAARGIERFLERRDFEIIERDVEYGGEHVDMIAVEDGEDLVFIQTRVRHNAGAGFGEEQSYDRDAFERMAMAYLAENLDAPVGRVRLDFVDLMILSDHRGFLKHHRAASSLAS